MGVWFNDPDVEMEDICWYNLLAKTIYNTKVENPELISVDYKLGAISCYVELHRNGIIRLHIFAKIYNNKVTSIIRNSINLKKYH